MYKTTCNSATSSEVICCILSQILIPSPKTMKRPSDSNLIDLTCDSDSDDRPSILPDKDSKSSDSSLQDRWQRLRECIVNKAIEGGSDGLKNQMREQRGMTKPAYPKWAMDNPEEFQKMYREFIDLKEAANQEFDEMRFVLWVNMITQHLKSPESKPRQSPLIPQSKPSSSSSSTSLSVSAALCASSSPLPIAKYTSDEVEKGYIWLRKWVNEIKPKGLEGTRKTPAGKKLKGLPDWCRASEKKSEIKEIEKKWKDYVRSEAIHSGEPKKAEQYHFEVWLSESNILSPILRNTLE